MFVVGLIGSILLCCTFTLVYVGSLYVWKFAKNDFNRDHPTTIKRRFLSVFVTSIFSFIIVSLFWSGDLTVFVLIIL